MEQLVHSGLLRSTLSQFASGVTVITTTYKNETHGMTANAFLSLSLDPPLVGVAVSNRSHMHQVLPHSKWYGISVLAEDQERVARHFAGQPQDIEMPFIGDPAIPLIRGAIAHVRCAVADTFHVGDHTLYVGAVLDLDYEEHHHPLLFFRKTYYPMAELMPSEKQTPMMFPPVKP